MTAHAKPDIDKLVEHQRDRADHHARWETKDSATEQAILATLEAYKRIIDATEVTEPVAWMNPANDAVIDKRKKQQIGDGNGYPNFSVALVPLAAYHKALAEKDAERMRAAAAERRLAELQRKIDGLSVDTISCHCFNDRDKELCMDKYRCRGTNTAVKDNQ